MVLGILRFQTLLMVVLLFICTCTYLHEQFPSLLARNKSGYATSPNTSGHLVASSTNRPAIKPICQLMPRRNDRKPARAMMQQSSRQQRDLRKAKKLMMEIDVRRAEARAQAGEGARRSQGMGEGITQVEVYGVRKG
nr:hypothetical protein B0A51_05342 [Rachicladosporium sp. CCFEE 5018]